MGVILKSRRRDQKTKKIRKTIMRLTFGSIAVKPQNRQEIQTISDIAYATKGIVEQRYGTKMPPIMAANITGDTVTFRSTEDGKSQLQDGIMAAKLRAAKIPFKLF